MSLSREPAPRGVMARKRRYRVPLLPLLITAVLPAALGGTPASAADLNLTVKITIERLQGHDFDESPDFYAVVGIDGQETNNEDTPESDAFEDKYTIEPNWEFSKVVPLSKGSIGAFIEIRDEDGLLRFDDDHADADPDGGDRNIDLTISLAPCAVAGDNNGPCGTFTSSGTGDERVDIRYRVEVTEPPSVPGLNVRCMHSPLWPEPGDTVTVTAESLDGSLVPKLADQVEVWVNNQSSAATSITGTVNDHTFTAGANFSYGCRVVDEGTPIFTGWRITQVGPTPDGRATPVIFSGPRASRVDFLLIPDRDNYSGPDDSVWQTDASNIVFNALYSFQLFLDHQDSINVWLSETTGDAQDAASGCDHEGPNATWADVGAIIHTDDFRDCAIDGLFSAEQDSFATFRHEAGHRPFGLADEYCPSQATGLCDGGYFETEPFPNVYEEPEDCMDDTPNLLALDPGRTADDCREFEEDIENWDDFDWTVSDPASNDLMVDNTTPQASDLRRINWYFDQCRAAGC